MTQTPRRILVVKMSSIGDVLLTTPIARALRDAFPDAHLAWAVDRRCAPIVEGNPYLDELVVMRRDSGQVRDILSYWGETRRHPPFDWALDLHGLARSALVTLASRASFRAGLAGTREGSRFAYNHRVAVPPTATHRVDYYAGFLEALGIPVPHREMLLPLSLQDQDEARAILAGGEGLGLETGSNGRGGHGLETGPNVGSTGGGHGLETGPNVGSTGGEHGLETGPNVGLETGPNVGLETGPNVGLETGPNAGHHSPLTTHHSPLTTHHSPLTTHSGGPQVAMSLTAGRQQKCWPAARFAELADRLQEQHGCRVIVVGAPGDRPVADAMKAAMRGAPVDLVGRIGLKVLGALLREVDLFVSADTGPMHMAAAVKTPVVALFGPTDPALYGPYRVEHVVLRKHCRCAPRWRHPVCEENECMRAIAVDEVEEAAVGLLARVAAAE